MAGTRILFYGQLQTVLVVLVGFGLTAKVAVGQIVPDDTLGDESSAVVEVDASTDGIVGGATRGANLFHSFSEFNVDQGRGVFFDNPAGIENILTRVTGGNVSEIMGALGVDGNANLFLINPNGITFGPDASLLINGSFVASTADSILFNNEFEFSATNPTAPPLLTVNTPVGLGFRDNPGEIINRSFAQNSFGEFVGLEVAPGKNLALVGGEVTFEAGRVRARGGNIELGGLSTAGTVSFNDDGSLNFPEDVAKADVILSNAADVDVTFTDGGSVNINAKNFELTSESKISTGIAFNASDAEARGGNITISTTEDILIDGGIISNLIFVNGLGNTGKIEITASNIAFTNGGRINNFNSGQGNLGDINLTASENITFDGIQGSATSGISNSIFANGLGNTGKIEITASNIIFTNGGRINNFNSGQGNLGDISLTASENITFDGIQGIFSSGIVNFINLEAVGDTGNINIAAKNLTITNDASISSEIAGIGSTSGDVEPQAGNIIINTKEDILIDGGNVSNSIFTNGSGNTGRNEISARNIVFTNGGRINNFNNGQGNLGDINLTASENITFDGVQDFSVSGISNFISLEAVGETGNISIISKNLNITNGASISSEVAGIGNSSNININVENLEIDGEAEIFLTDETSLFLPSRINSEIFNSGSGNTGDINLVGQNLNLTNGGQISTQVNGGFGNAGDINLVGQNLNLTNGGEISTLSFGQNSGNVGINVEDTVFVSNNSSIQSSVLQESIGNAGEIEITASNVVLSNSDLFSNSISQSGNAGNILLEVSENVSIDNSTVSSSVLVGGIGNGGEIKISGTNLSLTNNSDLNTGVATEGNAGSINLKASDTFSADNSVIASNIGTSEGISATGNVGSISVEAQTVFMSNTAQLQAGFFTGAGGEAGNIKVTADNTINFVGENTGIFTNAELNSFGNGSNIQLTANSIILDQGTVLTASSEGKGNGGNILIETNNFRIDHESTIETSTRSIGNAGSLSIFTNILNISNQSNIQTSTFDSGNAGSLNIFTNTLNLNNGNIEALTNGQGKAGNINIVASESINLNNSANITASVFQNASGEGGSILIETSQLRTNNGGQISTSTLGGGNAGNLTIIASELIELTGLSKRGRSGLFANAFVSSGNGGDLFIVTDDLIIQDGAAIDVSNFQSLGLLEPGSGEAGNLIVEAESITLDRQGLINAATTTGDGGNITLEIADNLILRENSTISARAFDEANGGNVSIDARFIIAFPSDGSGNDIIATAERGTGGNINLEAQQIFNLEQRNAIDIQGDLLNNSTNDLDASSNFSFDGVVETNTLDVDPGSGLVELPETVVDPDALIGQNACRQGRESSLVVTGRGGLPPSSNPNTVNQDLIQVNPITPLEEQLSHSPTPSTSTETSSEPSIVPAQGWVVNQQGEIYLVSYNPANTNNTRKSNSSQCQP